MTALDLLDHFAVLKGVGPAKRRREVVNALLEKTNLFDVRYARLGTFSGGMKQRFGIAQALLGDPKLIIVDEPTAGLDPEERVRFHNLLSEIGEHIIVILSTHIVSDVSDLCSQMAVIDRGEVVLAGRPLELAEALRGRIWKKLVTKDELADHEARHAVLSTRRLAGRLLIHVDADARPDDGFSEVEPDIEDVYFRAIKRRAAAS